MIKKKRSKRQLSVIMVFLILSTILTGWLFYSSIGKLAETKALSAPILGNMAEDIKKKEVEHQERLVELEEELEATEQSLINNPYYEGYVKTDEDIQWFEDDIARMRGEQQTLDQEIAAMALIREEQLAIEREEQSLRGDLESRSEVAADIAGNVIWGGRGGTAGLYNFYEYANTGNDEIIREHNYESFAYDEQGNELGEESIEEGKELVLAIVLFYEMVEEVIPQMDVMIIVNNRTVELYPERVYNDLMMVFETNHKGMTSIDIPINPAEHMNEMIPILQTSIQEFEDAHGWRHEIKLFNYSGTEVLLHLTKDEVLYNEFSEPAAEE